MSTATASNKDLEDDDELYIEGIWKAVASLSTKI
jgi:hypothetical protein